jgi:DNA (cytosine-5)-methyltransferase 1
MDKTLCELFAGVGGFRLGLERTDNKWETVFVNQWEPKNKPQYAFRCYEKNFGKGPQNSNIDIALVKKVPKHTLLVGGFPCQDYSVARTKAQGIHGKKGVLWWEIYRILKKNKPPFILLENVDRLLKSPSNQRGRDFGVILACLNLLGYQVEWRVINAAEYGFQQRRRRVFIFAYHKKTQYHFKTKTKRYQTLIIKDSLFSKAFPIQNKLEREKETKFKKIKKEEDIKNISDNFDFTFENTGLMNDGNVITWHTTPKHIEPMTLSKIIQKNVDNKYFIDNNELPKWKDMKGAKKINRISKDGFEYTFSEGAIAFPDPLNKPARTMLTSEGKKNRSTHVINDPKKKKPRLLTPVECERINGFPDNWTKDMPESFRYFCMGNALVVGIISRIGNELNKIINKEK